MISIINVTKTEEDCKIIFDWRNDPLTRSMSKNQNYIEWETFSSNFYNNYFISKIPPVFGCINNNKVLYCGLYNEINNSEFYVSLMMNPEYRSKKLAVPLLSKIIDYLLIMYPFITKIYAEIKPYNIASIKTFTNIGFEKISNNISDNISTHNTVETDLYHLII